MPSNQCEIMLCGPSGIIRIPSSFISLSHSLSISFAFCAVKVSICYGLQACMLQLIAVTKRFCHFEFNLNWFCVKGGHDKRNWPTNTCNDNVDPNKYIPFWNSKMWQQRIDFYGSLSEYDRNLSRFSSAMKIGRFANVKHFYGFIVFVC